MDNQRSIRRLAALGALCLAGVFSPGLAAEDLLRVEASVTPRRLARGQEGKIVLRVGVKPGIAVSALPAFTVEFEGISDLVFPKNFFTGSDLALAHVEIEGKECVDLSKPIEIPFTVSPKSRRGVFLLRGRVKYFAYDLKNGWCLKTTSKFSASYSTYAFPVIDDGGI